MKTGPVAGCRLRLTWLADQLERVSRVDLVLLLTVLTLLLYHNRFWYLSGPLTAVMVAGLVWAPMRTSALYWLVTLILVTVAGLVTWYAIDNHQYLFIYWCLGVFLALLLGAEDRDPCLAQSASLLLGTAMLLAALQKLLSASYMSGAFFEYTLLSDARFEWLTWALGHLSLAQLKENRALVSALTDGGAPNPGASAVTLIVTDQVRRLARALTWFTVGMEATLALLFLIPWASARRAAMRSVVLVVFLVAVYPAAPVIGFAWILISMGLAQLPVGYSKLRATLVGLFVVLPVVTVPPARVLTALDRILGH
jgi:hypothetical protein